MANEEVDEQLNRKTDRTDEMLFHPVSHSVAQSDTKPQSTPTVHKWHGLLTSSLKSFVGKGIEEVKMAIMASSDYKH